MLKRRYGGACQSSSVAERFLGKKEVVGPIPTFGSPYILLAKRLRKR